MSIFMVFQWDIYIYISGWWYVLPNMFETTNQSLVWCLTGIVAGS